MKQKQAWLLSTAKRWLVWFLLASLFAVVCVLLSQWQFNRRAEALAKIQSIAENYDQPAIELAQIADLNSFNENTEWRPVVLEGRFVPEKAVLVRNRPYNGQPGFLQVVPFKTNSGAVVAVETGWLPTGSDNNEPDVVPLSISNQQEIIGRLRPQEPTLNRDAPAGQIATINVDSLIEKVQIKGPVYSKLYVRLAGSYSNTELPKVLLKPDLTEGNHLSYALQWILFALMAFAALWWAVNQELQAQRASSDKNFKPKMRKKIGDDDKNAEDGLLA